MFSRNIRKILLSATAISMLSACAIVDKKDTAEESNWFVQMFERDGKSYAERATLTYLEGNFEKSLLNATEALKENPRNEQALLVGALASEKLGRYNRARQYYEDLIIINGEESSVLGTPNGQPQKIKTTAKNNLRAITIAQNNLTIENRDGTKTFALNDEAGEEISNNTIKSALEKNTAKATSPDIDNIFTPQQKNIVSRFLILRELAEKDFITKDEFLSRRSANIGGLLPLTNKAPGTGIDAPVPSPDLIIERLEVLKEAVETRTITPREFSAERDVIIEALMSPSPRTRIKNKAPSKNILDAADDLRRLEILYDLNLITERERQAERKAVEKYLGIDNSPKPQVEEKTTAPEAKQAQQDNSNTQTEKSETSATPAPKSDETPKEVTPNVSSPF